ncbi:MAG: ABC transporter permease [Paucibacter sp.]|nr:ABC transporter permease [Roseateles sp.]
MRLGWQQFRRDVRAGELRLLMLAVALAVAALCAVSFLADRIDAGLRRDAAQLLGGDAVIASDQPTPAPLVELADGAHLQSVRTAAFASMARAPDELGGAVRLVTAKAVGDAYPLRGRLQLADGRAVGAPAPGSVWADGVVLDALGLHVGQALWLGDASLKIAGVIANEPDRGAGFMSFAPRVMLNSADLPATHLIQPASRVTWRLAVAAGPNQAEALKSFVASAQAAIDAKHWRGLRMESLESGRPEMRQTMDRAAQFLRLVALLAALLAAVAVALAARDFAVRQLDACAMLRVFGESQSRIARMYAVELALAGVLASAAGLLAGFALHFGFVALLARLIEVELPPPDFMSALPGLALGATLLLGFGLAPVLQLARVPALRVIRRELGPPRLGALLVLGAGVGGFFALLLLLAGGLRLGLIAAGGFGAALLVFAAVGWGAVWLLRRLVPQATAPRWLLIATRQVGARPAFAVVQVSALAVGLLALALLVLLRTDLIDGWRRATPVDAPDRFVINLQPDQAEPFRARLATAGLTHYDWYPMIRGRLVAINGAAVDAGRYHDEQAKRLVEREFNLSHSATLPQHNQVTAGEWLGADGHGDGLSVEAGLAKTLDLHMGDKLRFDIGGVIVEAPITSLRKVDWASMRVNFFVLFPRAEMADLPLSYIAAYRNPPSGLDKTIAHEFPNLTVIDVSAQLAQVQAVLDQVIKAVQCLFGFALASGLVVLLAAVGSTREARTREFALMRAFGAGRQLLAQVQRVELLGVGALAGLLAGVAAEILSAILARRVFEFEWTARPWVPLACAAIGALLALAAGWWGLRSVLQRPVAQTLREASQE